MAAHLSCISSKLKLNKRIVKLYNEGMKKLEEDMSLEHMMARISDMSFIVKHHSLDKCLEEEMNHQNVLCVESES